MIGFIWKCIRFLLFQLDAETAHRATIRIIRWGARLGGGPLRIVSGTSARATPPAAKVWELDFISRVGLAAGFDKDAEILEALPDLGFGFVEVGTVTPLPQPGNPRPRLFRDPKRGAVFNRMGFNGLGAAAVAARVERARARLPGNFRIGINVGKNKNTPLPDAALDYSKALQPFRGFVDYAVINVSSPNTPGLRELQSVELLKPIVGACQEELAKWGKPLPLLLKLAPELKNAELAAIARSGESWGVSGWVMGNTLAGRWADGVAGGWSGAVLTDVARANLAELRRVTRLPIISVGGIMSEDEAVERIRRGAELVQVYTGWIYAGPGLPIRIARRLQRELDTASPHSVP